MNLPYPYSCLLNIAASGKKCKARADCRSAQMCVHQQKEVMQDEELRGALEAAEQRLKALDVEDLDAERDQLALTEHILQKLSSEEAPERAPTQAQPPSSAPPAAPVAQQGTAEVVQKPVAMLGSP